MLLEAAAASMMCLHACQNVCWQAGKCAPPFTQQEKYVAHCYNAYCPCLCQVEAFDSEIESLQSTIKRKQKPPARLAHLEESVTRHKTHIGRLEQIIRLLDNDALQPDDVSRVVTEEIPEYIENNQEDFDAYEVQKDGCPHACCTPFSVWLPLTLQRQGL